MIIVNWYVLNRTYNDTIMNQSGLSTVTDSYVCPHYPAIYPVIRPLSTHTEISYPVIRSISSNTKRSYPVILSMFNPAKCLYTDIQRVCTTMLTAPKSGQCPKCSKSTLWYINMQYPKYSKFIQIWYDLIYDMI